MMRYPARQPQWMAGNDSKTGGADRYIRDVHRAWEKKISSIHCNYNRPWTAYDPSPNLRKEWESFTLTPFPSAARGQVVDGVDLVLIHSEVARCIRTYYDGGLSFESEAFSVLEDDVQDLIKVVPLLVGDAAAYFGRLLDIGGAVLGEVPE
jgi:hypothetical protein